MSCAATPLITQDNHCTNTTTTPHQHCTQTNQHTHISPLPLLSYTSHFTIFPPPQFSACHLLLFFHSRFSSYLQKKKYPSFATYILWHNILSTSHPTPPIDISSFFFFSSLSRSSGSFFILEQLQTTCLLSCSDQNPPITTKSFTLPICPHPPPIFFPWHTGTHTTAIPHTPPKKQHTHFHFPCI